MSPAEVRIHHEAGEWVLRPSFAAIAEMEAHFDRSLFAIARDYAHGQLNRATDLKAILVAGLKGAGEEPADDLEAQMMAFGLSALLEPLGRFLAKACGIETA